MATATLPLPETVTKVQQQMAGSPYWNRVRRARALMAQHFNKSWDVNRRIPEHEPWIHIVAVDDGDVKLEGTKDLALRTFECTVENGACRIAEKTHRLATDQEIEAFKRDRQERERLCEIEDERINPIKSAQKASIRSSEMMAAAVQSLAENSKATRDLMNGKPEADNPEDSRIKRR